MPEGSPQHLRRGDPEGITFDPELGGDAEECDTQLERNLVGGGDEDEHGVSCATRFRCPPLARVVTPLLRSGSSTPETRALFGAFRGLATQAVATHKRQH